MQTEFDKQRADEGKKAGDYFNIPQVVAAAEADSKVTASGGYIVIRDVNIFRYRAVKDARATPSGVSHEDVLVRRVLHDDDKWYDPAYLDNLEEGVMPVDRSPIIP